MGLLAGAGIRSAAAQSALPPVFNPGNGHWYQGIQGPSPVTWPEARAAAEKLTYAGYRGHLVTITSAEEQQFVVGSLPRPFAAYWWIGAYQDSTAPDYSEPAGGWRWVTAEPFVYTHWATGEPNNALTGEHAAHVDIYLANYWNDRSEATPLPGYVVEYEPPAPAIVVSLQLVLQAVVGGTTATARVTLAAPAGPGGAVLTLFSSNPAAAVPAATLVVPAGATAAFFPIVTFPVAVPTAVAITAIGSGVEATATLQVLPASGTFPPGNLLANGSFEDPDGSTYGDGVRPVGPGGLPGWRITKGTIDVIHQRFWQPAPGQGRQSIDLVGTPGAGSIEQTFPTVPGQVYTFSGWLSHSPFIREGRANVFLSEQFFVQLYHSNALYGTTIWTDMRWQPFTFQFRPTAATTTLKLTDVTGIWDDGGGAVLDGLAVVSAGSPVPPFSPGAPAGLVVRLISPTQVELSWLDNNLDETGFEIQRRTGAGEWVWIARLAANMTRFSDYSVSPGTTYSYRVRAESAAGVSAWSNEAAVTILAP